MKPRCFPAYKLNKQWNTTKLVAEQSRAELIYRPKSWQTLDIQHLNHHSPVYNTICITIAQITLTVKEDRPFFPFVQAFLNSSHHCVSLHFLSIHTSSLILKTSGTLVSFEPACCSVAFLAFTCLQMFQMTCCPLYRIYRCSNYSL